MKRNIIIARIAGWVSLLMLLIAATVENPYREQLKQYQLPLLLVFLVYSGYLRRRLLKKGNE